LDAVDARQYKKARVFLEKMSENCFLGLAFEKISGKIKAFLPS